MIAQCRLRSLPRKQLALAVGLDPSHLSRLINGRGNPSPETCKRIATYFGNPVSIALRLAGWIDDKDVEISELARQVTVALQSDPGFRKLYEIYLAQNTPRAKQALVQLLTMVFEDKGEQGSRRK